MNHSRGALMAPIQRKRKERDDFFMQPINSRVNNSSKKQVQPLPFHHNTTSLKQRPSSEPALSNRLLAGYLAHEFLTQGTLLGQKFDPAGAEAVPLFTPADLKSKPDPFSGGSSAVEPIAMVQRQKTYTEVARLMKTDGAHIPGVVNPTGLARWLQM